MHVCVCVCMYYTAHIHVHTRAVEDSIYGCATIRPIPTWDALIYKFVNENQRK